MARTPLTQPDFLPMTRAEMDALGWDSLDVLLVTGDAYVDHPSFGAPLLGRWLVAHGYKTGLVAQPRWEGDAVDVAAMGRPRLFAGVTAGSLDSMLAHYTAFRKKRSDDAYTPGGKAGARPNRAAIVYANLVRRAFPGLPVALGGIEASLRRVSHYDFWSNALRRSVLYDAKASLVLYGMAETGVLALAEGLDRLEDEGGLLADVLTGLPGAAFSLKPEELAERFPQADVLTLPAHEAIAADPKRLIEATLTLERHVHQNKQLAVQRSGDRLTVLTPPGPGLSGKTLDALYALPYSRRPHPAYRLPIPAADMIRGSLNIHRGCAGGCSFCTLALHQGRAIRSRSAASVLREAARLVDAPGFDGSVSDVGGPSANMWGGRCRGDMASCQRPSCLTPTICKHFSVDQGVFVDLLEAVAEVPGVRHVRVASGWRMDLALADEAALGRMVRQFTGGQAKVAPEHQSDRVLKLMRKPPFAVFERFLKVFERESGRAGKEQYVVPYLMSAFPGCTLEDMRRMAEWFAGKGWRPNQVQCFIPLPGTAAAAMYFAGTDLGGQPLFVADADAERLRQHAVLGGEREKRLAGQSKGQPDRRPNRRGPGAPASPRRDAPPPRQGKADGGRGRPDTRSGKPDTPRTATGDKRGPRRKNGA